jgi:hypothetical protein
MITLITIAGLVCAGYAYIRLPAHSKSSGQAKWTAALLAVTGILFGYAMASVYATGVSPLIGFLAGFGVVHIPAAIILFVKQQRK